MFVAEAACVEQYNYEQVSVVPWMIEHIKAHAGIDIGDTLIVMHLLQVGCHYWNNRQTIIGIGAGAILLSENITI